MSRNGFQFNFSATFTDKQDALMTVKNFNLGEFLQAGYGKRIMLDQKEFEAFRGQKSDFNFQERRHIVLKSLINLAFVSICAQKIRQESGVSTLYHTPLLLALVNSVNTNIKTERNDLWAFFQVLKDIATGAIETSLFETVKLELLAQWDSPNYLLGTKHPNSPHFGDSLHILEHMKVEDLREAVFLSKKRGALQIVESTNSKEIAFQLKTADSPFALIRIGSVTKWKSQFLVGFESTQSLRESSFFSSLENSSITILMGSRSFFESWDSNRPNVIAFINIGVGPAARKFVMQSVGRGVRIEPAKSQRRRFEFLPDQEELSEFKDHVAPIETLYLYGTNRKVISSVMTSLEREKALEYKTVSGFELAPLRSIDHQEMPLLVPVYRDNEAEVTQYAKFSLGRKSADVYEQFVKQTNDSLLAVRDSLSDKKCRTLRKFVADTEFKISSKEYQNIHYLHTRILQHLSLSDKLVDRMRGLDVNSDIVHFRELKVNFGATETKEFEQKLRNVAKGPLSEEETLQLAEKLQKSEITLDEFNRRAQGRSQMTHRDLDIKNIQNHYFAPVVLSKPKKTDYIQHVIKEPSEVNFIKDLEVWLESRQPKVDGWMFSKIDEYLDNIHIPYFKETVNEYSRFLPDFVFWMCERTDYQIVFVDPKGPVHTSWIEKVEGYKSLFQNLGMLNRYPYNKFNVRVRLLLYNKREPLIGPYGDFWTDDPGTIFEMKT